MKESLWGYWLIILGLAVIVIMMLLQNYSTTDQQDYYLLKEITEAAMADAVDWGHYEKYGELRIVKEKFIEDFTRRFSETVNISKNYNIKFYDIYEAPPKVSVKVTTKTDSFSVFGDASDSVDVVNKIDAILETNRGCPYSCIYCYWAGTKKNFRQFSIQKVAGTISFSCFCKQKVLSTLYTSQQKVLSAFYTFTTKVLFIFY